MNLIWARCITRGWFDDPKNVDRIFVMNVNLRESLDGGKTLQKVE